MAASTKDRPARAGDGAVTGCNPTRPSLPLALVHRDFCFLALAEPPRRRSKPHLSTNPSSCQDVHSPKFANRTADSLGLVRSRGKPFAVRSSDDMVAAARPNSEFNSDLPSFSSKAVHRYVAARELILARNEAWRRRG